MSIELWGTFSVRDHLEPRAFVADVLLYDRIVVPTLPEGDDPASWPEDWGLARQRLLLEELGELAVSVPWTKTRREAWQRRFDADTASERAAAKSEVATWVQQDAAFGATRMLLADYANRDVDDAIVRKLTALRKARPGATLEAVAAYPSYATFEHDVPLVRSPTSHKATGTSLTQVFGWEFFVPEDAAIGPDADRKLLRKAIGLARTAEFIELRSSFYGWWKDVADGGISFEEARDDMEKRYAAYREITHKQGWNKAGRFALKVLNAVSGGIAEIAGQAVSATAETLLGSAEIASDSLVKDAAVEPRLKAAAMFHDARRRLGWKVPVQP
jgi:hypothetical protein